MQSRPCGLFAFEMWILSDLVNKAENARFERVRKDDFVDERAKGQGDIKQRHLPFNWKLTKAKCSMLR